MSKWKSGNERKRRRSGNERKGEVEMRETVKQLSSSIVDQNPGIVFYL